ARGGVRSVSANLAAPLRRVSRALPADPFSPGRDRWLASCLFGPCLAQDAAFRPKTQRRIKDSGPLMCLRIISPTGIFDLMSDVTRILSAIEQGDPDAASQLLPLVYDELRKLAAQKMAQEKPGQTLQATGLVHEAYLRLVDVEQAQHWN